MPICFGTSLHVNAISIIRHFTVSLWRVLHWLFTFFFLPQCKLIATECSVYCLCPGFLHRTRCMYPNLWSALIKSNRPPNVLRTKEGCVSLCLIQRCHWNMHPSSSRVLDKTCTILSYHYYNPKIREKNADLLCMKSRLCDFDRLSWSPNAVLWTQEACFQRCLIQRRFRNMCPPSSGV